MQKSNHHHQNEEEMIATTCEQSARLLACGVDPKTADMMWDRLDENRDYLLLSASWETNRIKNRKITVNTIPAWSLSALLTSVLPRKIKAEKEYLNYTLNLHPYFMDGWQIKYSYREYDLVEEVILHPELLTLPVLRCGGRVALGFDKEFIKEIK